MNLVFYNLNIKGGECISNLTSWSCKCPNNLIGNCKDFLSKQINNFLSWIKKFDRFIKKLKFLR
jgi:hypothetical protein